MPLVDLADVSDMDVHPPPSSTPNPSRSQSPAHQLTAPHADDNPPSQEANGIKDKKPKPSSNPKPKSTKPPPPRSPSPPPRPPLETIRLDIKLGGQDDYEVDIGVLSKSTGQRPPTPPPHSKRDTSDDSHSEGDDEGDGKRKRKKRKNAASEYYDTSDPFIDDSELAQDERTFFAQTKQKGFYVSSGQVALMNVNKTPKKPKSKKINILAPSASVTAALSAASLPPGPSLVKPSTSLASIAGPSVTTARVFPSVAGANRGRAKPGDEGSRESPIALDSDEEAAHSDSGNGKKRRKLVEIQPFHPELEQAIETLREAVAKENWEVKGKFPPGLKPLLAQVALKAIILGEYDDNFFNLMPRLFPYNKFTMTKLIKRTIWKEHTNLLVERQNALIEELRVLADEGFPKAKEEWEKSVIMWEKRQERAKADAETGGATAHSVEGTPACARGANQVVSDQGVRKTLYQKIVAAFPEGWLSSGQISRDVSVMKKKYEKEVMEGEA
ncbi:hypothetical protein A0H81_05563 [Grifola frondosa]|uniref:Ubinuclein middle domain-containing protein n=1 Tax=Grifola frondosa TaxID=5627 RepID=A0A1C7MIB0_GRIFR|nr:hypothetical protein A0H81_05563 [Grifola frondosa]